MGDTAPQLFGIELAGLGKGGRDDEEYQSFCLSCEVICGSTESAIMKVHLFTTEGFAGKYTFPCDAGPATATKRRRKKKGANRRQRRCQYNPSDPLRGRRSLTTFVMTCTSGEVGGGGVPDCNVQFTFIAPPFGESQLLL